MFVECMVFLIGGGRFVDICGVVCCLCIYVWGLFERRGVIWGVCGM